MPGEKNDLLFISVVLLGLKCSISQLLLRRALLHKSHKLLQCHQQQLRIMYEPHFYRKFRDNALRMQQCYCNNVHFLPGSATCTCTLRWGAPVDIQIIYIRVLLRFSLHLDRKHAVSGCQYVVDNSRA